MRHAAPNRTAVVTTDHRVQQATTPALKPAGRARRRPRRWPEGRCPAYQGRLDAFFRMGRLPRLHPGAGRTENGGGWIVPNRDADLQVGKWT
jgi:hypothetical protein